MPVNREQIFVCIFVIFVFVNFEGFTNFFAKTFASRKSQIINYIFFHMFGLPPSVFDFFFLI